MSFQSGIRSKSNNRSVEGALHSAVGEQPCLPVACALKTILILSSLVAMDQDT